MSPGSINSFNASLSASSYQWLKHQIKEIQGNSSCNSLISPESLPLLTEAPPEERKTILLKTDSRGFDQVSWLFSLICWIPKYIGGSEISGQHWILVRASRYETHTKVWHWMEFVFLQAKYFTHQCFVVHNIQPRKLLSPPF